ncbi:DUF423 domain-containing protein [Fulvimarina sp. 2208YS6-2-32]|uniref:DUF423 domain-containing protein n=1 Tax=Fulvimarina uroteuthidis TaxID=3098149 RepID=A0ABU5I062_9HYPH|nr:DUF423 domain-containing protein [Fulvimarina sp. 2208YS6-2-32]MDY8108363.1 DUF423 domain-containing protein [Fulvimarina sp. 2208YS6-2-32]
MRSSIQFAASVIGASGVGFAAYASHGTADQALAAPAAAILLTHGPTLLALSIMVERSPRILAITALLMIVGVVLFAGDLAARIAWGERLFEGAAPAGGGLIILSWLLLAIEAPFAALRDRHARKLSQRPIQSRLT